MQYQFTMRRFFMLVLALFPSGFAQADQRVFAERKALLKEEEKIAIQKEELPEAVLKTFEDSDMVIFPNISFFKIIDLRNQKVTYYEIQAKDEESQDVILRISPEAKILQFS